MSNAESLPGTDDLAVVIFTSATTGLPKGITHTHGDIVAAARRVAAGYARTSDYRPEPAPAHLPPGVVFNPFGHMAGYSRLAFRMWIGRPTGHRPPVHCGYGQGAARALPNGHAPAHPNHDPHAGDQPTRISTSVG